MPLNAMQALQQVAFARPTTRFRKIDLNLRLSLEPPNDTRSKDLPATLAGRPALHRTSDQLPPALPAIAFAFILTAQ